MKFIVAADKTPLTGRFAFPDRVAVIAAALLVASWLMPLHFLPWVSWHSEVLAFLSVLVLGALGSGYLLRSGDVKLTIPFSTLMWPSLGLLAALQWVGGLQEFAGDAFVLNLYFALCAIAWVLGYSVRMSGQDRSQSAVEVLAAILLTGATLSALIALVQVFDVWETASWINRMPYLRRPGGNLGQPNHLATLLVMGMASLLFLAHSGRLSGALAWLLFTLLCVGVAVSESRTGALSFLLLALWVVVGQARAGLKISRWTLVLASALFLMVYIGWPLWMSAIGSFAPDARVNTQPGLRLVVWPQLIQAVLIHPWFGWGLRGVSVAHNAVAHAYDVSQPFTYAHNILLDLAVGAGLPLTVLIVMVTAVWLCRRIVRARQLLPWYCVATVLPVATHSMLEFPHAYAYFLAPAMFMLGVLESHTEYKKPRLQIGRRSIAVGLSVVTVLGAWSALEYFAIEEDFRIARYEALRIGQAPADHQRPKIYLLTQLDAMLEGTRLVPQPGMSSHQLERARKVALRFPWPALQNRYALSLALNGNPDEATRQLRVMRALHGEKAYADIQASWMSLANDKYPQLHELVLP